MLDNNGNRTKLTWSTLGGGDFVDYCYDNLNRMVMAQDNANDCASAPLATYTYDAQSRRTNLTYGNGAQVQTPVTPPPFVIQRRRRSAELGARLPTTSNNNTFTYGYTKAHETQTIAASNSTWFWQPSANGRGRLLANDVIV